MMILNPEQSAELLEFHEALVGDQMYKGIRYFSTQVSGASFAEVTDPDIILEPVGRIGYWPGGVFGSNETVLAVADTTPVTVASEVNEQRMREFVQQLRVGQVAVARYEHAVAQQPIVAQMQQRFGYGLIPMIRDVSAEVGAPFSYLTVGTVAVSFNDSPPETAGAIHYPAGIHPKTALAYLRKAAEPWVC